MQHITVSKVFVTVSELFVLSLLDGLAGLFSFCVGLAEKWGAR